MHRSLLAAALFVSATLIGCASTEGRQAPSFTSSEFSKKLTQGMSKDEVRSMRGEPFASYAYPEGTSWFYNTAIRDMQRDRAVFNPTGHLVEAGPAWTRNAFTQIEATSWTAQKLLQHFGPPIRQEAPRPSLLEGLGDAPPIKPVPDAAEEGKRNWMYGFREYNRYFIVSVTVNVQGIVSAIEITEDPNNITF